MTKDAEKLLKIFVDCAKELDVTAVAVNLKEIQSIPNLVTSSKTLCEELKMYGYISNYIMFLGGKVNVYLTTDGLEYFEEKLGNRITNKDNMIINVNGGQVNIAKDNANIIATQNNGINGNELDNILKGIMDNLSSLQKEDADEIIDVVEMVKEELIKTEPKISRLKNCLALIAPMFTIANGVPALANNLQKLQDFILQYIR